MTEIFDVHAQSLEFARSYYGSLAYHNWEHVNSMLAYVDTRIPVLETMGIHIDKIEVEEAIVWHDAGYATNSVAIGFRSKESYSGHLAKTHLRELGSSETFIAKVVVDILATELGQPRPTNEANLVVEADIHNVAGDSNNFFLNGLRLARENIQMGKLLPNDAIAFMKNSAKFLQQYFNEPFIYIAEDGTLIEFGNFTTQATRNITRMGSTTLKSILNIPGCASLLPEQWKK